MTPRRLLALLIALTVTAAAPGVAQALAAPVGDCMTMSSPAADDGSCGAAEMSSCSVPCCVGQAAVGRKTDDPLPMLQGASLADYAVNAHSVSRPPDTAPPKNPLRAAVLVA